MPIQFKVDVDGVDKLIRGLEIAPAELDKANAEAMTKAVFLTEGQVKALTPRVTGRLFASINGSVRPGIGETTGRIGTLVSYAKYVESGRGPIVAKHLTKRGRPGYLKFRSGGRWVYARSVGPALGRHMFKRGLEVSLPSIRGYFKEAAQKVADVIKRGG